MNRSDDPDAEFGLAISTMLLISPVVWQCYFVVAIWPLWVLGRRLYLRNWPARRTNLYLAIPLLLAVPAPIFGVLAMRIGRLQAPTGLWSPGAQLFASPRPLGRPRPLVLHARDGAPFQPWPAGRDARGG